MSNCISLLGVLGMAGNMLVFRFKRKAFLLQPLLAKVKAKLSSLDRERSCTEPIESEISTTTPLPTTPLTPLELA